MKKKIKNQDMFGHSVMLNFNRAGDTFNTFPGGLISIVVRIILGLFLLVKMSDLVTRNSNSTGIDLKLIPDDYEGLHLHDQGFLMYFAFETFAG